MVDWHPHPTPRIEPVPLACEIHEVAFTVSKQYGVGYGVVIQRKEVIFTNFVAVAELPKKIHEGNILFARAD